MFLEIFCFVFSSSLITKMIIGVFLFFFNEVL